MARGKKSEINTQLRKEWLDKYESGLSVFKISVEYERDPRTVKSHIERALREREEKEARVVLIREALRNHQNKLITHAQKLYENVDSGKIVPDDLLAERMHSALKSHLPRSPLWRYLEQISRLYERLDQMKPGLRSKLEGVIKNDGRIPGEDTIRAGLLEAFGYQVLAWAKGHQGLSTGDSLRALPSSNGLSTVEYGDYNLGTLKDSYIDTLKSVIEEWERNLKEWPEYAEARGICDKLSLVKIKVKEELATIIERGIVPGRCKYCPA